MKIFCNCFSKQSPKNNSLGYWSIDTMLLLIIFSSLNLSWSQQQQRNNNQQLIPFNELTENFLNNTYSRLFPVYHSPRSTSLRTSNNTLFPNPLTFSRRNIQASQLDALPSHERLNSFIQNYLQHERLVYCRDEFNLQRKTYRDYLRENLNLNTYDFSLRGALSFMDWLRNQPSIRTILGRLESLNRSQPHDSHLEETEFQLLNESQNILNRTQSISINCSEARLRYRPETFLSSMETAGYQEFLTYDMTAIVNRAASSSHLLVKSHCESRDDLPQENPATNSSTPSNYSWSTLNRHYFTRIQSSPRTGLTVEIIYLDLDTSFYFLFDFISGDLIRLSRSNSAGSQITESYLHPENQRIRELTHRSSLELLDENEFNTQEENRLRSQLNLASESSSCSSINDLTEIPSEDNQHLTLREDTMTLYTIIKSNHLSIERELSTRIRTAAQQLISFIRSKQSRTLSCSDLPRRILDDSQAHQRLSHMATQIATWYKSRTQPMLLRKLRSLHQSSQPWLREIESGCSSVFSLDSTPDSNTACRATIIGSLFDRPLATESECGPNTQLVGYRETFEDFISFYCSSPTIERPQGPNILTDIHLYEDAENLSSSPEIHFEACQRVYEPWVPEPDRAPTIEYCINSKSLLSHDDANQLQDDDLLEVMQEHILRGSRGIGGTCIN